MQKALQMSGKQLHISGQGSCVTTEKTHHAHAAAKPTGNGVGSILSTPFFLDRSISGTALNPRAHPKALPIAGTTTLYKKDDMRADGSVQNGPAGKDGSREKRS
jgi:hypothetical protein